MTIQWFPGHMAKAKREVQEKLKLVDFVMELVDARAPLSSQNPMLQEIMQHKRKMIILMKKDLADALETDKWLSYFENINVTALAVNVNEQTDLKKVVQVAHQLSEEMRAKLKNKGVQPRAARAMIVGIPNVGKSTLINRLAKRKVAKTGNRPGITRQQAWIKIKNEFELLDTPGILWPKFADEVVGYRLAALGTIKDNLLALQDIAAFIIKYVQEHYPSFIEDRYAIKSDMDDMWDIFVSIGKRYGALESGGNINFDKVAEIVIQDLRTGKLGNISLETVKE